MACDMDTSRWRIKSAPAAGDWMSTRRESAGRRLFIEREWLAEDLAGSRWGGSGFQELLDVGAVDAADGNAAAAQVDFVALDRVDFLYRDDEGLVDAGEIDG